MTTPTPLAKAEIRELDADFKNEINRDKWVKVQFNPETLKVSFANQIAQPQSAGDQRGTPTRQFVGAGTTKLSVQLWFDVNAPLPEGESAVNDVRRLTQKVAYFITPGEPQGRSQQRKPPSVRFLWGSFQFDGIMESLEESLEFFSPEGRPLRANVTLSLTQQKIQAFAFANVSGGNQPGGGGPLPAPGTQPMAQAPSGSTLQSMAESQGQGANWQDIAQANGIENPRLLLPGQLINLNATTRPIRI